MLRLRAYQLAAWSKRSQKVALQLAIRVSASAFVSAAVFVNLPTHWWSSFPVAMVALGCGDCSDGWVRASFRQSNASAPKPLSAVILGQSEPAASTWPRLSQAHVPRPGRPA